MACHWIKFKDADGVERVAHVKMAKPRRYKCMFCDHPDAQWRAKPLQEVFFELDALDQEMSSFVKENIDQVLSGLLDR